MEGSHVGSSNPSTPDREQTSVPPRFPRGGMELADVGGGEPSPPARVEPAQIPPRFPRGGMELADVGGGDPSPPARVEPAQIPPRFPRGGMELADVGGGDPSPPAREELAQIPRFPRGGMMLANVGDGSPPGRESEPGQMPPRFPRGTSIKRPGLMSLNLDGLIEERESSSLTVDCLSSRSPRIGGLSLELGSSPRGPTAFEDSWKGEILADFLFLGDRMTAGDSDRLNALGITHVLNVTQDIPNFYDIKDFLIGIERELFGCTSLTPQDLYPGVSSGSFGSNRPPPTGC
ncbi:hypothetical protein T492DRAFT_1086653 [Pavlovales sp. CCMP2436]|nr:hypothetical protein T492DRAFT_1086653 [Pavlovales sp. CCMP2436]